MIDLVIKQLFNHCSSASAEVRPHRPREAGEHRQGVRLAVELADGHAGGSAPVGFCWGTPRGLPWGLPSERGKRIMLGKALGIWGSF